MMEELIGSFCFRILQNSLQGNFTNNHENNIVEEIATPIQRNGNDRFSGTYKSSWTEEGEQKTAELTINTLPTNSQKYLLRWDVDNEPTIFTGEGFLMNGLLIGYYIAGR